ncbi:MAG: electron transfer flavoprotein subunit alpha/FixB family protein [Bacteroidales bacterium]|nr:electron transfer flavoprotein subunit alpha/FixB family protein [Bacteroidales bacterium]
MSVLVYCENWDGKFKKLSFELVSYASGIAKMVGTTVTALSIGSVEKDELKKLGNYGANKIVEVKDDKLNHLINSAYSSIIGQVAEKEGSLVIILSNNFTGKALAPRVSVKLKAGLIAGVSALPSSMDPFIVQKKAFTGKAFANVKVNSEKKVLTLSQNSYKIAEVENSATVEAFSPALSDNDFRTEVKDVTKVTGKVLLFDAEIVVSGGRGMKGPENWGTIEELAELLGAATACSRPVSDEGWRPHEEHTGQTGKIIAPNLYIAAGISGAIQHLAGVSSSKCIVAINKDNEAPIFEAADYGVIGDVQKVMPELIQAVKEFKAEN